MGKGDMRTKRGKIHRGTYGNSRRRKKRERRAERSARKPGTPPPG